MELQLKTASADDAPAVAALVVALTAEITRKCDGVQLEDDLAATTQLCRAWLGDGRYAALLAWVDGEAVGVLTFTESYALYAGGKICIIQECYVAPAFRAMGVGQALLEAARTSAEQRGCAALELCTPPLPEFQRSLEFYQQHAYKAVGGRKMRRYVAQQ